MYKLQAKENLILISFSNSEKSGNAKENNYQLMIGLYNLCVRVAFPLFSSLV